MSVEKDHELEGFGGAHFSSSITDEWEGLNIIYKFDVGDVIVALGGIEATDLYIYPMVGACVPPRGFINDLVFNDIKHLLHQQGALVIHVIAPDCFFEMDLKNILENHFLLIYKLRFEEDFEFVIVAANSISFATIQENDEMRVLG
ncbi:hypothetical protein Hanom_Chr14g01319291 [Helianthus anomalus]